MTYTLEILNSIINAFTLGTYPVRPFLLIGYGALIFLAAWAYPFVSKVIDKRVSISKGSRKQYDRAVRITALASLALLFLIPIICEISVFNSFGIPQRDLAIFFTGDEITNTRIVHNHFGKTAIAQFLGHNDVKFVQSSDTGAALLSYVPRWVPPVELALFILALLSSLYVAASAIAAVPNRSKKIWLGALFTLVGFLVLEKSLDGGLVSDGAGFACAVYALSVLFPFKTILRKGAYALFAYIWILCGLFLTGFYWPLFYLDYGLLHTAVVALTLFALYYGAYGTRVRVKNILIAVTILVIAVTSYEVGKSDRTYLASTIIASSTYLATYESEATPNFPTVGAIGNLQVYDLSSNAGDSIKHIGNEYSLPYWYQPIYVAASSCSTQINRHEERFFVLSTKPLVSTTLYQGIADVAYVPLGNAPAGWYRYGAKVTQAYCVPRSLNVVHEMLRLSGATSTIVYGLQQYTLLPSGSNAGDSQ
ncbi:MAG: hypothetical protein JWN90_511 [Parcubacteria group bacterium]|nr:hypothetical protein [Parcubacteria group bacterium]